MKIVLASLQSVDGGKGSRGGEAKDGKWEGEEARREGIGESCRRVEKAVDRYKSKGKDRKGEEEQEEEEEDVGGE